MLSRVADSLYWLSRYIERAENLARLIEVSDQDSLDSASHEDHFAAVLRVLDAGALYAKATEGEKGESLEIGHFLAFSEKNPDSIRACIGHARENARMVRDQISEEMWLELNRFHLFIKS
ncbi:MAG: alpha-E domain-containing protein, partial [Verrucomicrobiales bacterium]